MSWDISLVDPNTGKTLNADKPHGMTGGTYSPGDTEMWLNITWNYSKYYYAVFDGDKGIKSISGMIGKDSIPVLKAAIGKLGGDRHPDYWKATEGNARAALEHLLVMAKICPDGVWEVD